MHVSAYAGGAWFALLALSGAMTEPPQMPLNAAAPRPTNRDLGRSVALPAVPSELPSELPRRE